MGEAAAGPRALHPTHSQAYESSSRAWPFEPPERGLYLSPPPSLQEDYGSKTWYSGSDDPLTAGALAGLLRTLLHAVTVLHACACTPTPFSSPAQISESGGRDRPRRWAPCWKGTVELLV